MCKCVRTHACSLSLSQATAQCVETFITSQCQSSEKATSLTSHSFYHETFKHFHFKLLTYNFLNVNHKNIKVLESNYIHVSLHTMLMNSFLYITSVILLL